MMAWSTFEKIGPPRNRPCRGRWAPAPWWWRDRASVRRRPPPSRPRAPRICRRATSARAESRRAPACRARRAAPRGWAPRRFSAFPGPAPASWARARGKHERPESSLHGHSSWRRLFYRPVGPAASSRKFRLERSRLWSRRPFSSRHFGRLDGPGRMGLSISQRLECVDRGHGRRESAQPLVGTRERRSKRPNTNDRRVDPMRRLEGDLRYVWRLSEVLALFRSLGAFPKSAPSEKAELFGWSRQVTLLRMASIFACEKARSVCVRTFPDLPKAEAKRSDRRVIWPVDDSNNIVLAKCPVQPLDGCPHGLGEFLERIGAFCRVLDVADALIREIGEQDERCHDDPPVGDPSYTDNTKYGSRRGGSGISRLARPLAIPATTSSWEPLETPPVDIIRRWATVPAWPLSTRKWPFGSRPPSTPLHFQPPANMLCFQRRKAWSSSGKADEATRVHRRRWRRSAGVASCCAGAADEQSPADRTFRL